MGSPRRCRRLAARFAPTVLILVAVAGCADAGAAETATDRFDEQLQVLAALVSEWESAPSLDAARAAAEGAANVVVGPHGPAYGDRDGDGNVRGEVDAGLLPGSTGSSPGLTVQALDSGAASCVRRDVLGGAWDDPQARWAEMDEVIDAWTPEDDAMGQLASPLQRVVGWAELTQRTDVEEDAEEYAVQAAEQVVVAQRALYDCGGG